MSPSSQHTTPTAQPAAGARAGENGVAFALGAHLVTPRFGYEHHGIYVGNGKVVHYAGLSRALLLRGPVEEVTLEQFADGHAIATKNRPLPRFAPEEIVARARARLGEDRYRLTSNNCEHFCEWCLSGESRSEQVERYVGAARVAFATLARRLRDAFGRKLDTLPGVSA